VIWRERRKEGREEGRKEGGKWKKKVKKKKKKKRRKEGKHEEEEGMKLINKIKYKLINYNNNVLKFLFLTTPFSFSLPFLIPFPIFTTESNLN
jgi:IS5 family transposase